jgi:hypothetical protein
MFRIQVGKGVLEERMVQMRLDASRADRAKFRLLFFPKKIISYATKQNWRLRSVLSLGFPVPPSQDWIYRDLAGKSVCLGPRAGSQQSHKMQPIV